MQRSDERILTTHVGSLPRSPALRELLIAQEGGAAYDTAALEREMRVGVDHVVAKQLESGIDVGNDGEQPRVSFSTYVAQRMTGFGGTAKRPISRDIVDHPDYAEMLAIRRRHTSRIQDPPAAIGPVAYRGEAQARQECELLNDAMRRGQRRFTETFVSAASPGVIACTLLNQHYRDHAEYVTVLAAEMKKEYDVIHASGHLLQIDAPDLAMERARMYQNDPLDRFLEVVELHVQAINAACVSIPADRIRLHICWGNYDGPHTHDVPLEPLLPILYRAKVGALSIEMANPCHAHEWKTIKRVGFPEHMVLLPGVIDSTANQVEHPELIADRIERAVDAVGDRTRVIASSDCGFGTFSGSELVAPSVVWKKFESLAAGARLATKSLFGRS